MGWSLVTKMHLKKLFKKQQIFRLFTPMKSYFVEKKSQPLLIKWFGSIFFTKTRLERKPHKIMKNDFSILVLDFRPESIFRWARWKKYKKNHSTLLYIRVGWFLLILIAHPGAIDCLLSLVHKARQDQNFEVRGQRSNFRATGILVRSSAYDLRIS